MGEMSRTEPLELAKVVRGRERVTKRQVAQREAELRADVESQLSAMFEFNDAAWVDVTKEAQQLILQADAKIARPTMA